MCDATVQYSDAGTLVKRQEHLPLFSKFSEDLLGREIEVDLGRGEMVMAQETLQR
jgi:hypothetical protein